MALNPLSYTEKVVRNFLRYQLTTYPFADQRLDNQMRQLLSLDHTRDTPLLKGPYISLSRAFESGATVEQLVSDGVLHEHMQQLIPFPAIYGHQENAILYNLVRLLANSCFKDLAAKMFLILSIHYLPLNNRRISRLNIHTKHAYLTVN